MATGSPFMVTIWYEWELSCMGVYYTDNEGGNWHKANVLDKNGNDPFDSPGQWNVCRYVNQISVHPTNPDIMYMTMFKNDVNLDWVSDHKEFGALFRSDDGGESWVEVDDPVFTNRYFINVQFHPTNPDIIYASGHRLYKSVDGGSTWSDITSLLNSLPALPINRGLWGHYRINLTVPNKGVANTAGGHVVILATVVNSTGGTPGVSYEDGYWVYHSNDALSSSVNRIMLNVDEREKIQWVNISHNGLTLSHDPNVLYAAGRFFGRSDDGGSTFATPNLFNPCHADYQQIGLPPFNGINNGVVYCCTDGGLWRSDNFGANFTCLNKDLVINQLYGIGTSHTSDNIFIGNQDNANYYREDDGTWSFRQGTGDGSRYNPISSLDPTLHSWTDLQNHIEVNYRIRNNSGNLIGGFLQMSNCSGWNPTRYRHDVPNTFLAASDRLYTIAGTTQTTGNTFQSALPTTPVNLNAGWIPLNTAVSFDYCYNDPDIIYVATSGQWMDSNGELDNGANPNINMTDPYGTLVSNLFKSTDGGNTWTYLPTGIIGTHGEIQSIAVSPTDPNRVWITFRGYAKYNWENQSVYMSTDGGATWTNYSNGLPYGPVTKIVYQHGTNDKLFIAKKQGVFYRDATMSEWQSFNNNLSNAAINDIEISYCSGMLYAATYGRGVWATKLYSQWGLPQSDVREISSDETWNSTRFLTGNLRVKAGKKLTIATPTGNDQIALFMPRNGTITVEPGAHLIIDNARITNGCDTCFWYGIIAQGNKWAPQQIGTNSNNSVITLKNSAVLEHARFAVNLYDAIEGDPNKSGGVLRATESFFVNNKKSIAFVDYDFENKSVIKDCQFYIDDNYKGHDVDYPFGTHISMWNVKGVNILGSGFYNWDTHEQNKGKANGIIANNAGFKLLPFCTNTNVSPCPSYQKNIFHGFRNGVNISGDLDDLHTDYITDAVFDSNTVGVRIAAKNDVTVINSEFEVGNGRASNADNDENVRFDPDCAWNIGIFTYGSERFIIQENNFQGVTTAGLGTVGTMNTTTSLANDNVIYKCNYNGLNYGALASRKNGTNWSLVSGITQFGLKYRCNGFYDNDFDTYVGSFPSSSQGIAKYQGAWYASAGNTFTSASTWNIANEGYHVFYHHYPGYAAELPSTTSGSLGFPTSTASSCPTKFSDPKLEVYNNAGPFTGTLNGMKTAWDSVKVVLNTAKGNYLSLIDGGSTSSLVSAFRSFNPTVVDSVLLSYSPYVSKEAMMEGLSYMDTAELQPVVMANPELLQDGGFFEHLQTGITPALSEYAIDQFIAARDTLSARGQDEANMSMLQTELSELHKSIIVAIKLDTTDTFHDSLLVWQMKPQTLMGEYSVLGHYFSLGDTTRAQEVLDSIGLKFTLSSGQRDYHDGLETMVAILKRMLADGRALNDPDSADLADMNALIASSTPEIAVLAQQPHWPTPPNPPPPQFEFVSCVDDGWVNERSANPPSNNPIKPFTQLSKENPYLKVAPNPARELVHFNYNVADAKGKLSIIVMSAVGQVVKQFSITDKKGVMDWDTNNVPAGSYLYKLSDNRGTITTGKLVIIK